MNRQDREDLKAVRDFMRILVKVAEATRRAPMNETARVAVYAMLDDSYQHLLNCETAIFDPDRAEMYGFEYRDGWAEARRSYYAAREAMMKGIELGLVSYLYEAGSVELMPQVLRRYRNSTPSQRA